MHPQDALPDAFRLVEYHRPDIADTLRVVPLLAGPMIESTSGMYDPMRRTITLNNRCNFAEDSLAALLIHEGTHADDHRHGILPGPDMTLGQYVASEQKAFRAQIKFWSKLYPYGKLPAVCVLDADLNSRLAYARNGQLDAHVDQIYTNLFYRQQAGMRI